MKSGVGFLFLLLGNQVGVSQAQVDGLSCLGEPLLPSGYVQLDTSNKAHLSSVSIACAPGYEVASGVTQTERTVTCINGRWSDLTLRCYKTCDPLEELGGGMFVVKTVGSDGKFRNESKGEEISVNVQRHGTSRTVSCREGFADAGGQNDQKLTCRDGNWTPLQLDCHAFCSQFKLSTTRSDLQITNQGEAYRGFGQNSPKSFVEVSCAKGTGPVGGPGSEKLYCLGGEWDLPSIRCGPLCPGLADFAFTKKNLVEGDRYSISWGGNFPNTFTTVTCMPGYAPLKRVDVLTGVTTSASQVKVWCMDGRFEDSDFHCKKSCTPPELPAPQASVTFGSAGADSGLEHGAFRNVQCAQGYMPLKDDIASQEITCIDGEWTAVSIQCLPSCPLESIGFHLCDWSDESKTCTSPYELQWNGPNGTEVASTSWVWESHIRAGEGLQVRCNEALGFKPTDGTSNSWVDVRCQGTHSGKSGVDAFSWYARECERSCLAGDLNLGPAYKIKVRVPESSTLFSSWLSIEQAARKVGWVPDQSLVAGVQGGDKSASSLIQQEALDGKVSLMTLAARLHPSYQHHVELAKRALQKGSKAGSHPQGVQIQRQLESSYLQRKVTIGSAVPYRARSTLNSERARLTYLAALPKDKQSFTGAVAFVQLAARNRRHLEAAFPKVEAYTKGHLGKRRTVSRLSAMIERTFEEKKNHPIFIQTAAQMGVENKLLPLAKIIIDTLTIEGKSNPIIDSTAASLGCVNNYTKFGELFPDSTVYSALTCDILLTETRPKAWGIIKDEFYERRPDDDPTLFQGFNWTKEEACATTITGMLARLGTFPDHGYSFNPDLTHVGDICGLSCGAPYCPAVNGTDRSQDQINHDVNIKLALSSFTSQTCVDVDALTNAFLPGATCPYISAMYLKATKSRALKMTVEACNLKFMDVLVAAGAYDPDLGLVDMDYKFSDVCNFQCSSCPFEDLSLVVGGEEDYEEWVPEDPFADQPWFNALFPYGTEAEVTCAPGFSKSILIEGKAVGDSEILTCLGTEFSVRSFQCAPTCPGYRAPSGIYIAEGNGVSSERVEFGSKVQLSCAEGSWGVNGVVNEELTCIDGSWTLSTLTCVKNCDPVQLPTSLASLEVYPDASSSPANPEDPYSHGGSVLYGCKEELGQESYSPVPMLTENGTLPYSYVSEDRERVTCVNGNWTPLTIMCKRDCPAPQIPVLARYRMYVDTWDDMLVYDEDGVESVKILTEADLKARIPSISRRHGSEYRIYCKDETLSAAEGPMSGFDTIRCLDGQWTRQTLVCKYRCGEFFPRAEDREVNRYNIVPYEPDVDFPYLFGNLTVPHSTMRRVTCNEELNFLPNSALKDQSLTCNDGHWDILHLDCKKACQPMLPALGYEYNPMVHFPPVGFCIWDKVNKQCDTPSGVLVRHNEQNLIACADDYAPVQGNVPITVTCEDGIYSNVYVQCAPVCLFSSIIFGDNQVPKCYTKAAPVLDHGAVAAEVKAAHDAAEREALEALYKKTSFIQTKAHRAQALVKPYIPSSVRERSKLEKNADSYTVDKNGDADVIGVGTQWSANAMKWVTPIDELATHDGFKTVAMVKPFSRSNVTDVPYEYNALTPSCSGQTKSMKFRKLPLDHGSEITYKCVEGSDPFGDVGYSNTSDCIWGEWTARGLQCKKRCSINSLKQQITYRKGGKHYRINNDMFTDSTWPHEWFVKSGEQVTLSCATNTTAWPQNDESDGTEKLRCDDGEWDVPSIVCMKDCQLHPLEDQSWLYGIQYADTGSKTHGSVADVACVDGAYPGKVDAPINQPSECVDGEWQPLGYPCFLGCSITPVPNVFYRSTKDNDPKFVKELKSALSDQGTLLSHGHEYLMSCNAGYTRGVNFVEWAPVTPSHEIQVLPPKSWMSTDEDARVAWATASRAVLEAQFSYDKSQCNAGVITKTFECFKYCYDPRDSVLKYQLERLRAHEVDGNTKEWRNNFKDFPEIWPHDSEYRVECDESRNYMNTGPDVHQIFTLKCRDGVWDIPKISCRKACASLEETHLGQEILAAGVYEFYGRAPRYLMDHNAEYTEIKGSLALGKENYRVHGATYNLQCRPAYTPIHLDKHGSKMPGIWEGDEIPKARLTSRAYSNLKNFAGMDQWGAAAKGSRSSAGDEYDALLEGYMNEANGGASNKTDLYNTEEKTYDRQLYRDQIKCVNGDWVGFEMKCVPKCPEFLHPENEFMQAKRKQSAYRVYELSDEELYMVDTSEPTKGKEVRQNVGTKRSNPYVVSGTRRMVTCAKGYTPLSVKGTNVNSDGEYFGLATCQAGRWLNSAMVCSKDCDEPYTNVLYRKCLAWHSTYNSSPCSQFKAAGFDSRPNCAVAHCGERKKGSNGSYEGQEGLSVSGSHNSGGATNSTMTPYVIYRTAVRRAIEVEEEEGADTRHFAGVLAKQAGTVHVVACNVNEQFALATRMLAPVYTDNPLARDGVALVSCFDGKWTDIPFFCDKACFGSFDLYAAPYFWLPVFSSKVYGSYAPLNPIVQGLFRQSGGWTVISPTMESYDYGVGYPTEPDAAFSASSSLRRIPDDFVMVGPYSGGVDHQQMELTWPMRHVWRIHGPGACDARDGWKEREGDCIRRLYGRGSWVTYESLIGEQNYYSICAPGAKQVTTNYRLDGTAANFGRPLTLFWTNAIDPKANSYEMGWTDPRLPVLSPHLNSRAVWLQTLAGMRDKSEKDINYG